MEKKKSFLGYIFRDTRTILFVAGMFTFTVIWAIGIIYYWNLGALIVGTLILGGGWVAFLFNTYKDWKEGR